MLPYKKKKAQYITALQTTPFINNDVCSICKAVFW